MSRGCDSTVSFVLRIETVLRCCSGKGGTETLFPSKTNFDVKQRKISVPCVGFILSTTIGIQMRWGVIKKCLIGSSANMNLQSCMRESSINDRHHDGYSNFL